MTGSSRKLGCRSIHKYCTKGMAVSKDTRQTIHGPQKVGQVIDMWTGHDK